MFRGVRSDLEFLFHFLDEIPYSKQNSPRWDAALGLFYLPLSHKKDARLK